MKKTAAMMILATLTATANADLTVVASTGSATVNLTTNDTAYETLDWVMLGVAADDSMARDEKIGANYIGDVTITGTPAVYTGGQHTFGWDNDGTLEETASGIAGDWQAKDGTEDQTISFTVSNLAIGEYQMVVYTSTYQATGSLSATIGSNSDDDIASGDGRATDSGYFTIKFDIEDENDSVFISYAKTDLLNKASNNVAMSAISIQAIPEPATFGLVAVFGGGLLVMRRNRKK